MDSIHILMKRMIDYAGLFPPASLDMPAAVANYADYRQSDVAWALGRFILPAARLDEFERAAQALVSRDSSAGSWPLSALLANNIQAEIAAIQAFNERHGAEVNGGTAVIDTIEMKVTTPEEITTATQALPDNLAVYYEVPITQDPSALVQTIGSVGACAKVRTGGTTQELFPAPADLLRFIHTCVAAHVPFKATAGLHHPIRAQYRLTYERGSASGTMYGFLNVFLCAAFLAAGMDVDEAMHVLIEESAAAFQFDDDGLCWRTHRLDNQTLRTIRQRLAISFGSCSFQEPIDDLKAMKLL